MTDKGDFAAFYAATFSSLCAQLYIYTGDMGEAQDVVQEAFTRALPRWSRLAEYDDPAAWIRKVAWNLATSRWRRIDAWLRPFPPARAGLIGACAAVAVGVLVNDSGATFLTLGALALGASLAFAWVQASRFSSSPRNVSVSDG